MTPKIRIDGLNRVEAKFERFEKGLPKAMEHTTKEAVIYVHAHLPNYPPEPAYSTYRRTLTLWRTITGFAGSVPDALSRVEKLFGEIVGFVGTKLKYAPWVIDRDRQTAVHREHGWWNLQDQVEKMRDGIVNVYRRGVERYVQSIF